MKSKDVVRLYENKLHLYFGSTGEHGVVTQIPLDQGVYLKQSGQQILWSPANSVEREIIAETFGTEALAKNAFEAIQQEINAHTRRRKAAAVAKGFVKWVVLPCAAVMVMLSINMYAARSAGILSAAGNANGSPTGSQVGERLVQPTPGLTSLQPQPSVAQGSAPGLPPTTDPRIVKQAIDAGTRSDRYAVALSHGEKGTLYVFSDPACPHCQKFEPELEKLKGDYTIQLFPVSVIGGDLSKKAITQMMCAPVEQRSRMWSDMAKGRPVNGDECDAGKASVEANDQIFRKLQFLGTPTIINANGQQTPLALPNKAEAIAQWLDRTNS